MDEVYFIEHYCLVDGKHIILKDYQKRFIQWLKEYKSKYQSFFIYPFRRRKYYKN